MSQEGAAMTENRRQVLEMLASGKVSADEAERLLAALDGAQPAAATNGETVLRPALAPKYLRVIVDSNEKDRPVHINVRVPLQLLRAGVRLASLIPGPAQERVNQALREQGVEFDVSQIRPENLNELLEQLHEFSVDIDHKPDDVKIKIFAE
jgi:hypothetical protein